MSKITNFVEKAFSPVPDSEKRNDIIREIIEILEANAEKFKKEGKNYEDAVNKAIVEFGDMNEIIDELREKTENTASRNKAALWFSIVGSLTFIILIIFINLYYASDVIWWVYPTFAILWWPLSLFFFGSWRKNN